jgi:tetratricopeptide (TPR) repeat protein
MGDLLASKLDNFPEALEAYQLVLQDVPSDAAARSAVRNIGQEHEELREDVATILLPALQEARLFEDVVEVLELRLTIESDSVDRAQTLRAMARVLESDVGDAGRSHATLLRAMAEVPEDASVHAEIERLCAGPSAATRWGAYADALTERAQTTFEADLAKELYSRLGQIAEQRLRDSDRAVDAYTKAVDQVGDQPEILQALDRLFTNLGKWAELTDILDRLAPLVDSDAERAELHFRSALVQIDRFSEAGQGLAELRMALELDTRHEGARQKLEELVSRRDLFEEAAEILESVYRSSGAMDKLTGLSEKRVEFAETPGERIEMRKSLARVLEDEMHDSAGAQRVLQQGLKDDPSDTALLDEIERLADGTGDWAGAGAALALALEESDAIAPLVGKELCLRLATWFA